MHSVQCDHLISVDWLRQTVLVFSDIEDARSELARFGGKPESGAGGAGFAVNEIDGSGLFWAIFPGGNPSVGTVVHEAVHVVDYLLEFAGVPISPDAAEVRCYMTEWLANELLALYPQARVE